MKIHQSVIVIFFALGATVSNIDAYSYPSLTKAIVQESPKSAGKKNVEVSRIRSALGHTFTTSRGPHMASFLRALQGTNTRTSGSTRSVHRHSLGKKLDYNEIQGIIDVSRPYYKLENERLAHPPADCKKALNNAFICTVRPEMPIGRESGPISTAEAGRHMAIAGSIAAALNQPEGLGKHYYLALDNIIRSSLPSDDGLIFDKNIEDFSDENDHIMIYAICSQMKKRSASSQVIMKFSKAFGGGIWYLATNYSVIPDRVFKKLSPFKKYPPGDTVFMRSGTVDNLESPYALFKDPHDSPDSVEVISSKHDPGSISLTLKSRISHIPAGRCLGHFDGNPAFPIAFMAAYLIDLGAKSIGILSGNDISFKQRCPSLLDEERIDTYNGIDVEHPQQHGVKLLEGEIEALKLVYAETHGLVIYGEAKNVGGHVFSVKVKAVSSVEEEQLVAHGRFLYELFQP